LPVVADMAAAATITAPVTLNVQLARLLAPALHQRRAAGAEAQRVAPMPSEASLAGGGA
jgi:hypothetical protein